MQGGTLPTSLDNSKVNLLLFSLAGAHPTFHFSNTSQILNYSLKFWHKTC